MINDDNSPPFPFIDDLDPWYEFDEKTGQFTFDTEHANYQETRAFFAALGLDLHACRSPSEIRETRRRHLKFYEEWLHARVLALEPKNLEEKWVRAEFLGHREEADRLFELIKKRKRLGIKRIK